MQPATIRKIGLGLSLLVTLALAASALGKIAEAKAVLENLGKLGFPLDKVRAIGILELAIAALYAIPRTAPVGVLAMVAYFGGATAVHVRADDPFLTPVLFGLVGVLAFGLRRRDLVTAAFARG